MSSHPGNVNPRGRWCGLVLGSKSSVTSVLDVWLWFAQVRLRRNERGTCPPLHSRAAPSFWKPYFLLLGSEDSFPFGRGCESRIDNYVVDRISRLGNDKLCVNWRFVTVRNGKGSGAVRVHRVGAGANAPARRDVAVCGNPLKLGDVPVAVEGSLGRAINQQGEPVRKENCSVDCKGVRALNGQIAASAGIGRQG